MSEQIVVFGYGPVGRSATEILCRQGRAVRVAQRRRPADLADGATFQTADVLDGAQVLAAAAGADQIVVALGFAYEGKVWRQSWPQAMANLIAAAEATGARLVFVDNLYMYGPQTAPLTEDMPLSDYGVKPAVRSAITRQWRAASDAGRIRLAALRAPDFYGPDVTVSHLGDVGFGALSRGRRASLLLQPDTPHDFAYVPDIGRAVVSLLDAGDDAYGEVWHMPSAPTLTPREILALGAKALGVPLKVSALPLWLQPVLGLAVPMLREMSEMRFTFDRPYRVDATKFTRRFWSDVTPFEIGAPAAALSFRAGAGGG